MSNGTQSAEPPDNPPVPIVVRSVTVKRGRVVCDVVVAQPGYRYMNARIASAVLDAYPTLKEHACVNAVGKTFGCVLDRTSVPHVLEHLWIDLMVRASEDPKARFVGTSEWLDEDAGLARVQVSYRDDLQALRTFNEATQFLNIAVLG